MAPSKRDWRMENCHKQAQLLTENPETRIEKDIWNLKWMLYSIQKDSAWYRMGMVKTLRRAIKTLEEK